MWSPDSKKILYTDRKNRIVEVDIASKAKRTVMQNPEGEFYEVNYSPDSQWITYTKSGANNMSVIYVYHLTSGKEYPVTEKMVQFFFTCFQHRWKIPHIQFRKRF